MLRKRKVYLFLKKFFIYKPHRVSKTSKYMNAEKLSPFFPQQMCAVFEVSDVPFVEIWAMNSSRPKLNMASWWLRHWRVCLQCGRPGFNPWVGKIPWRRKWQPSPVFLPEKSHGQKGLVGYSPWGPKETWLKFSSVQ